MSPIRVAASQVARVAAWLLILFVAVVSTAWLAASYAEHRVARHLAAASPAADPPQLLPHDTVELDFFEATGIPRPELAAFLQQAAEQQGVEQFPVHITLQDDEGEYLVDSRVIVRWRGGEYRLLVGESGVIRFAVSVETLRDLKVIAPRDFPNLTQKTIPLGTAYEPEERPDLSGLPYEVVWDGFVLGDLQRQLVELAGQGRAVPNDEFLRQLRRRTTSVQLAPSPEAGATWTPEETYRRRKDSVVVIGTLYEDDATTRASGVILASNGIVATAYHVLDKPLATARGVMTSDGRMFAVVEVLAASRADDVALLRVDASDLHPAPLSVGDPVGADVTVISHPGHAFFTLTEGTISRYWAATHYGRLSIKMTVTAEFADGSSGAPIFNDRGAVTGLVSSTDAVGNQMVTRIASPAQAIHALLGESPRAAGKRSEKTIPAT